MSIKTASINDNTNQVDQQADSSNLPSPHYLMWFRRDLRIHDNTALTALCERAVTEHSTDDINAENIKISAVYFCTPEQWLEHDNSVAQVDHIARTLPILAEDLHKQLSITLSVYVCPDFAACVEAMNELCISQNVSCLMANHEYEGNEIDRDRQLTERLAKHDIEFIRWHDQCVLPPLSITTNDGDSMYKVFTPFYRKWRDTVEASQMHSHDAQQLASNKNSTEPTALKSVSASAHNTEGNSSEISSLGDQLVNDYQQALLSNKELKGYSDSTAQLKQSRADYPAGETAAKEQLAQFIADDIDNYNISRDVPSLQATSHMSAYLTIGAISARECYMQAATAQQQLEVHDSDSEDINRWISELAWRDFYRHVLVEKPELIRHQAYKKATDEKVDWSYDKQDFAAWCAGKTGVPLVDAAMRCLNATGFMHNRLRMVTAMFLTKDLLIDWRWGERYFMQQLIDGDFASNNGGWQWSASTGTDSSPYFRIMNPFSQAKSHDPDAIFIKTWLPELKALPASILHSEDKMRKAFSSGGKFVNTAYPVPIVEHKQARLAAIAEFKK